MRATPLCARSLLLLLGIATCLLVSTGSTAGAQGVAGGLSRIGHIVVIYEENHSFDNLYGTFPGANGLSGAPAITQVNRDGSPMSALAMLNTTTKKPDEKIPGNLPPVPFTYNAYYQPDQKTGDMIHAFYTEQVQIDGGKMDKFAAWSDSHGQPFNYFTTYAAGQARTDHLKDESDFLAALTSGTVPAVAYIKPIGADNEHPGYATISQGEQHAVDLIKAIQASPIWNDTVVIVTYDEHGGSFDHVPPPTPATDGARADRWGPGVRVPTIVISPFARQHFVDHTPYDTTSILKLIEERFGLAPLGTRDAAVNDLTGSLTLTGAAPLPGTGSGGQAGATPAGRPWQLLALAVLLSVVGALSALRARRMA